MPRPSVRRPLSLASRPFPSPYSRRSSAPTEAGIFGGHTEFGDRRRYWDFLSPGHGKINFEKNIRALNEINYIGPLSVEWEDGGINREHGAVEACEFIRKVDFSPSSIAFDSAFDKTRY